MDERLQKIFDSVPADEPRSRLEPFRELILRWRRQGRTYRRVQELLGQRCGVKVAYGPLYRFIQRRSRPRTEPSLEPQPTIMQPMVSTDQPAFKPSKAPLKAVAALREAARPANHNPVFTSEEPQELFVYDPDKPLTNKPN